MENILRFLKIMAGLWISVTVLVCCGFVSHASTNVGAVQINSISDVKNWYQNHGVTCNDSVASTLYNNYFSQYNNCLIFVDSNYGYYFVGEYTINGNTCTLGNATYSGYFASGQNLQGYNLSNQTINWATYFSEVQNIDFTNVVYDPLIPTPNLTYTYTDKYFQTNISWCVEMSLKNASPDYYLQVQMENTMPSYVEVFQDGYTSLSDYQFESRDIYSLQSMTVSSTVTDELLNAMLSSGWRADVLSYDDDNVEFYDGTNSNFANSALYISNIAKYKALYRGISCFYGNQSVVRFRFFKVVDGVVYGGKVVSWGSMYSNSFEESIPDYYIPYDPAQGYENETITEIVPIETANPNASLPQNQTGKKTGLNINISLGSNVPNYPNYPTIATYNLDNMLVSTINQGQSIGGFLSGVCGFAQSALAFIPDYVWQLAAFGLGLSIVVMFLKIL